MTTGENYLRKGQERRRQRRKEDPVFGTSPLYASSVTLGSFHFILCVLACQFFVSSSVCFAAIKPLFLHD
ncbi:hypothetical protein VTL71DRAFT_8262, partial [Oculimacula yallundae]